MVRSFVIVMIFFKKAIPFNMAFWTTLLSIRTYFHAVFVTVRTSEEPYPHRLFSVISNFNQNKTNTPNNYVFNIAIYQNDFSPRCSKTYKP